MDISKIFRLSRELIKTKNRSFARYLLTKDIFDKLKSLRLPNVTMKTLSMGMSNSYKIAIEEGSTMVRLGTIIFGMGKCKLK